MRGRFVLLGPAWALLLTGAAPEVSPAGDGGGARVVLRNPSVVVEEGGVGPADGALPRRPLPGYGEVSWHVQCQDAASGPAPRLRAGPAGRPEPIEVPSLAFPEGPPVLLVGQRGPERAALTRLLGEGGPRVHTLAPDEVPLTFAALRFAPLVFVTASDWARLATGARAALRGAVAAGSTLVVAADGSAAPDALAGLAPIRFGELERPGAALRHALPGCASRVALVPEAGAVVRVEADGAPLIVDAPLGLGRVRVVAVQLGEIAPGPIAAALLERPADPTGSLVAWLDQRPPLTAHRGTPLAPWTWAVPGAFLLLGLLARRRPVTALFAGLVPVVAGAVLAPATGGHRTDEAWIAWLPLAGGGALGVGSVDVTLSTGGGHALPAAGAAAGHGAGQNVIALEDAGPVGACAVTAPDAAWWIVAGEPGERRRLSYFVLDPEAPAGGPPGEARLPEWPPGPLAAASLTAVTGGPPLPIEPAPEKVVAWRVEVVAPPAEPPQVLEAPPAEGAPGAPGLP